jgi:tRNA threonylcarbamoyladenosine biosynthesis protein TsaE
MSIHIRTESVEGTKRIAATIAPFLHGGDVLVLSGDLGGGKTAFVQGLAAAVGIGEAVTSPTFALVQTYRGNITLHHLDAYRLQRPEEFIDLNLPELLEDDAIVAIEWGERLPLPRNYLVIRFNVDASSDSSDVRLIDIEAVGPSWANRETAIADAVQMASKEC